MPRPFRPLALLLPLVVLFVGCEESVEPTLNTGRPFTLYGVLDPAAAEQALRVVPIELDLTPESPDPIDASVRSIDVRDEEAQAWRDSLVQLSGGRYIHVFTADFQPEYGTTYLFEVERSDGAMTTAFVTVPSLVEPVLGGAVTSGSDIRLPILWPGAPRLNDLSITYTVRDRDCDPAAPQTVTLPLGGEATRVEFGWTADIPFRTHAEAVFDVLETRNLELWEAEVRVLVSNEDWVPPGGVFDPEVLVDPTVLTNVTNGFGFVGAGYPLVTDVTPEASVIRQVGFQPRDFGGCE